MHVNLARKGSINFQEKEHTRKRGKEKKEKKKKRNGWR